MSLTSDNRNIIVEQAGLYLICYGMYAATGTPGLCTISFTPGGYDNSAKIPLTPNTLVSGAIVRRMGAGTRVGLHPDSADNNTIVSLPAANQYCNAYLTVTLVGPYPTDVPI